MVQGVAVVWMPVEDIERAKGFYRDTLGLPIQKEDGPWAEVDAHGLTIGLDGREPARARAAERPAVRIARDTAGVPVPGRGWPAVAGGRQRPGRRPERARARRRGG